MRHDPVALDAVFASFDEEWSPQIVTTVNDYDVRVAKVRGEHVWHVHENTDEFFLVLDGELSIGVRDEDGEHAVTLAAGSVYTVPRGTEHKPSSPAGARILMLEPSGTVSTGDRHDEIPEHVPSTTGQHYPG